jgi:hypothetical protein
MGRGMDGGSFTAKNYRERANELRAQAQSMTDPGNRKIMLSIADNYEQLAKNIEAVTRASNRSKSDAS